PPGRRPAPSQSRGITVNTARPSRALTAMTKVLKPLLAIGLLLTIAIVAGFWFARVNDGGSDAAEKSRTLYTCGMHPQIIRDEPGDCPICGMKLTPVRRSGQAMS